MENDSDIVCTNLLSTISHLEDLPDNSIVKAVLSNKNSILFFSRESIPYQRVEGQCSFYRQTGISAFRKDFLIKFSHLEPTPLEITESVDFLRILEHGHEIKGVVVDQQLFGVDEPEHVERIERFLREDQSLTWPII